MPWDDLRGDGFEEIAYRVNMIDVILGALTVALTYFLVLKIIARMRASETGLDRFIAMFTAAVTAFMVGFANDFWENAVETETYMPSMFMQMIALWLVLRWDERKDDPRAVRYLFAAVYILGLGNGVHLTVLLIAPTLAFIVYFARPNWFNDRRFWYSMFVLLGVAAIVKFVAGLGIQYAFMAAFALIVPFALNSAHRRTMEPWKLAFYGFVLAGSLFIIGFSVYPTVMVRAYKDPAINEGDPDTWQRYTLYMERDQYGQENMYTGMFERKADFSYQFGFMYFRYLLQQFPIWGPTVTMSFHNDRSPDSREPVDITKYAVISVFLVSLLLYGLFTHARLDWKTFSALMLFLIASSIGLVLYLNMENPQVRERSYFFLGSYYIIMYWFGLGIWGLMTDTAEWLSGTGKNRLVQPVTIALAVIFATLPPAAAVSRHIDPDYTNFEVHDRSHDWAPWDYGYNILISCEPNAVLFTNGDNDTFPLWYLQEVEGIRRDVRIVNLSLLNTDWYILQLKNEGITIPIEYSEEFIREKLCGRDEEDIAIRVWDVDGREVTAAGITWTVPVVPTHIFQLSSGEPIGLLRVQDIMVIKIVEWVNWSRPIYFAVTVANENKTGLDDYLAMEGMVYKLEREKSEYDRPPLNVETMHDNIFNKYQYRFLTDKAVYKPENTLKLITNYFIGFAQLSEEYALLGDREMAVETAWAAIEKTPTDTKKRGLLYQIFLKQEYRDVLRDFVKWETGTDDFRGNIVNRIVTYKLLAAGHADDMLRDLLKTETSSPAFMDNDTVKLEDRLQVYGILNVIGDEEETASLVEREIAASDINGRGFTERLSFGTSLLQFGIDAAAVEYFNSLVTEFPDNVEAWKAYAAALYSAGDYEKAVEAAVKLNEIAPNNPSARQTREIILDEINRRTAPDSTREPTDN